MANPATGAEHRVGYVAEAEIGTTPTTPAFKVLPITGTSLGLTKDAIESEELGSRNVRSFRHGNRQVGGGLDFEFNAADFDDLIEAVFCGEWEADTPAVGTNQLKTGSVRRGFTFFRENLQFLAGERFNYFTGCEMNEFNLTVAPNQMVTGSFAVVGVDNPDSHTEIAGSTYVARSTEEPFDSFTGAITEGGEPIALVTNIELSLVNGIEPSFVVFQKTTARKNIGKIRVSGTLTAQFVDYALYDKFRDETISDMEFELVSTTGITRRFKLPRIKFNSAGNDVSGDTEIPLTLEFVGLYDATDEAELICEAVEA